jgi:hypothetical protein
MKGEPKDLANDALRGEGEVVGHAREVHHVGWSHHLEVDVQADRQTHVLRRFHESSFYRVGVYTMRSREGGKRVLLMDLEVVYLEEVDGHVLLPLQRVLVKLDPILVGVQLH